ncbi:MAG: PQQ-binding-like beta-propeller repeat protein [Caulobacterales bacterium]|nr:PQQ-binding-like beta-propeller repeat protein [Caulobacterales bacterium]
MSKITKLAATAIALALPAIAIAQPPAPPPMTPEQAAAQAAANQQGLGMPSAVGGAAALPGPPTVAGAKIGMTHQRLLTPDAGSWPTYSGDYTGRRYSPLEQITPANIDRLKPAWTINLPVGAEPNAIIGGDPRGVAAPPSMGARIGGSPLMVDGILYVSAVNNAWALDSRTGKVLWHFHWKTRGGTQIGNRGMAMWGDNLYFETPDNYLVSLNAKTGRERWHVEIAPLEETFFSTPAPVVVKNHVIVGTGNDGEQAGRLQSFDPVTGERQWIFYTVPMNEGDKGLETWKDLDYARHGGGQPWVPGAYDPQTNLYIFGTSEPKPGYFAAPRGDGDALYTAAQIAVDVDTGKMKWAYQTSPNETHDWDSAQTPVLTDITFKGKPRKVMVTASRNGYFFVLDRVTGEHLLTSKFALNSNWASGINAKGQPVRIPAKDHLPNGALVSTPNPGATNWPPPAYSPKTGLFYMPVNEAYAMYYTTEADPRGSMGLGGKTESAVAGGATYLKAMDPKTGKIAWTMEYPGINPAGGGPGGAGGLLVTASNLLFNFGLAADGLVARDAATGKPLWNSLAAAGGNNAPSSYMVDGKQYILSSGPGGLIAFSLDGK